MESMTVAKRTHTGWSKAEDALLFERAAKAQSESLPLKAVFDEVARQTGRRPNSVRNYYYARIKQGGDSAYRHSPAFVPFTEAESVALLEAVLEAQAAGESVRACTLRLGDGDQCAMLRYQNKYRSLIRNRPELVQRVRKDMAARGISTRNPYAPPARRAGRPSRQPSLSAIAVEVASQLEQVDGLDVKALLSSLGALALQAVRGAETPAKPAAALPAEEAAQEEQALRRQLSVQQQRCDALTAAVRSLVRVNAEFLRQAAVVRTTDLSGYLATLETSLQSCRQLLTD